jgi:uncharacterized protein (TIGR04255 family)
MPQDHPHYDHSPITEAVLDIRVEQWTGLSADALAKIPAGVAYSTIDPIHMSFSQIQFGPRPSATTSSQHSGFNYKSADLKYVIQAQVAGFTLSRLAPYESWPQFSTEAKRLWNAYKSIAKPVKITAITLRYLNRIDIPLPLNDFSDYLRTVPVISSDLPQGLSGYFMQLTMPLEDLKNGMVIINETMVPPPSPDFASILLDILVSISESMPTDDESVWEAFEKVRHKKNLVFNSCLTEKAKEMFK